MFVLCVGVLGWNTYVLYSVIVHCMYACYITDLWSDSCVYCCQSCFIHSGLEYEIYSGGGPSLYLYCVVCYHVIWGPCLRSGGCIFIILFMIQNALGLSVVLLLLFLAAFTT